MFLTIDWSYYLYSNSILVDNCGALYIVNNKDLFKLGTFYKASDSNIVYIGTTLFPINRYSRCIIYKVLDSKNGSNTKDLILEDIALIEGFYINIILETYFGKAGI